MSKLTEMKNRSATHILTTRIDGRHLATLASFWHSKGEPVRTYSELLRLSIEEFTELLVVNNLIEFISSHTDALDVLNRLGLNSGKINKRYLAKVLANEDMDMSHLNTFQDPLNAPKIRKQSSPYPLAPDQSSPDFKNLLANIESDLLNPTERVEAQQEITNQFKSHLGVIPENFILTEDSKDGDDSNE